MPKHDDIAEKFDTAKARADLMAEEAIRTLFHSIPWQQRIDFSNGKSGSVESLYGPVLKDGRWKFGIDIKSYRGEWHFEYTVEQTGWGGKV